MAGIYIHIPFCKTRCIYCDFYSTIRDDLRDRYVAALCRELELRKDYLRGETVKTIYLGGGTPSQLTGDHLQRIFRTIDRIYGLSQTEEITLEANPDDLTPAYVAMLRRDTPVNRVSMGIQTFDDEMLRLLHRRHDARTAIEAVSRLREMGFDNLSIDLIYGLPGETDRRWETDLDQAVALGVEHISAYHLTYEEGTPLHRLLEQHTVHEVEEEASVRFFTTLIDRLSAAGYDHYEISNFCLPGRLSQHNSAYWTGTPYLGLGPSAHSFDGDTRQWNVRSLTRYIKILEKADLPEERDLLRERDMSEETPLFEIETLDTPTRYNEYVMTGLRTRRGISLGEIEERFGRCFSDYCGQEIGRFVRKGLVETCEARIRLTRAGIFISDGIISDLMFV